MDHFIKEKLHIKNYIRYQDDGILLSNDKEYLKYCLKKINQFVLKYGLHLNDKTKIINVSKNGVDFIGFRFYISDKIILKIRNNTKKKFKRKVKLIKKGKIENSKNVIASYKEYLKYCLKKINQFVLKYGLHLNDKTKIINVSKNGVDFIGFRFYISDKIILKIRNNTKKKFKRKVKLIKKGKIENSKNVIASYKGHFKWGNCYNLLKKYLAK